MHPNLRNVFDPAGVGYSQQTINLETFNPSRGHRFIKKSIIRSNTSFNGQQLSVSVDPGWGHRYIKHLQSGSIRPQRGRTF